MTSDELRKVLDYEAPECYATTHRLGEPYKKVCKSLLATLGAANHLETWEVERLVLHDLIIFAQEVREGKYPVESESES